MNEDQFLPTEVPPEISVIIVSWNASGYLDKCLESLSSGIARTYEVIVVDNNSSDGSPTMVMNKYESGTLLRRAFLQHLESFYRMLRK
jgi:glycosyltransferase involved in cell wall biosynthesis